jgi:general L-amino acid transport system substrate-binding protein
VRTCRSIILLVALFLGAGPVLAAPSTLETVKARGRLICAVTEGTPGFSAPDAKGEYKGLDADMCRAVAAAIFDDPTKVTFRVTTTANRFTALQSGEVDLLSRVTTFSLSRNTTIGIDFPAILYYDGQGFMVHKSAKIKTLAEMNGATICLQAGTTTELNVADYFKAHNMKFSAITFQHAAETLAAYESGRCDAYSNDLSSIYALKVQLKVPADHMVLPDNISREPLAPGVRQGDFQWSNIVRWSLYAMVNGEELGITSKNVEQMKMSTNPEVRRVLGMDADMGQALGLSNDWAFRIIKHVGNYGEAFDRDLGKNSPLGIERGLNALWKNGGIQYAPPIR